MTVARSKNTDKNACDRLFSQLVRSRGVCEYPNCDRRDVVTAHIIGRRFSKVRVNTANAWALCPTHHYVVDNWPDEKMRLVALTIGTDVYDALRTLAEDTSFKVDWAAERAALKELLAAA